MSVITTNTLLLVADEKFLCRDDGVFLQLNDVQFLAFAFVEIVRYTIKNDTGSECYVVLVEPQQLPGYQWLGLRQLLGRVTESVFQTAGRALQILRWHTDHQYCGRCGRPTQQHVAELAKSCHYCGVDFYPRLSPCIITLVTRGDYCLLAWHARSKEEKYSCLAGFIEVGETPEQTLEREVMEEVGVTVNNIRYLASQPWPFPGQLMLGYFADYVAGDIRVDQQEIVAAHWYRYDQLPNVPPASTISGLLIQTFVQQRQSICSNNK